MAGEAPEDLAGMIAQPASALNDGATTFVYVNVYVNVDPIVDVVYGVRAGFRANCA
jgi:hypothetical protein